MIEDRALRSGFMDETDSELSTAENVLADTEAESESGKRISDQSHLTRAEIASALKLSDAGKTQVQIAQVLGCSQSAISRLLADFSDTRLEAGHILRKGASKLAERIVQKASPMVALEVLDRLEVTQKHAPDTGKGNGVTVLIGVQQGSDSAVTVQISDAGQ